MHEYVLAALMFPAMFVLIFSGFPVALSLLSVAFVFGYLIFGNAVGHNIYNALLDTSSNLVLGAIPLFVFMGAMLQVSGISKRLFAATKVWLGWLPGGLAVASTIMCAIFAATSGVIGAVEIVVGLMAIPTMVKAKYSKSLISGIICSGGALGTIIPPSIVVVIYASVAEMSVGDLFAGILIPGMVMVGFFVLYTIASAIIWPHTAPRLDPAEFRIPLSEKLWLALTALLPCVILMFLVLGSIFLGVASPTEAAAFGAFGSMALAAAYKQFNVKNLIFSLKQTVTITSMVMLIMAGGGLFSNIFILSGGKDLVSYVVEALNLGPAGMIALFLVIIFILGFLLDWTSVVLVTIPIFDPLVRAAGVDPIWFAVMVCVVIQTSYLTPPMAPSIFFLRSITPKDFTFIDMYKGIIPFVLMQLATLAFVIFCPWSATYLTNFLFRM